MPRNQRFDYNMNVFLLKTVIQDEALNLSEAGVFSLTCQIGDDVFVLAKI